MKTSIKILSAAILVPFFLATQINCVISECTGKQSTPEISITAKPIVFIDMPSARLSCDDSTAHIDQLYIINECIHLHTRIVEIEKSFEESINLYQEFINDAAQIYQTNDPKYISLSEKLNKLITNRDQTSLPFKQALLQMPEKIRTATETVAKDLGAIAVLNRHHEDIILDPAYDITTQVIAKLNVEFDTQTKKE